MKAGELVMQPIENCMAAMGFIIISGWWSPSLFAGFIRLFAESSYFSAQA